MKKLILKTESDTAALAKSIAKDLKGGEVLALTGDLGSGKTTFTQYLAKELKVKKHVNSPTFVIMKVYEIGKPGLNNLAHLDAYRLDNSSELNELGLDLYINQSGSVVVIEWADKIRDYLKGCKNVIWLDFVFLKGKRSVSISNR